MCISLGILEVIYIYICWYKCVFIGITVCPPGLWEALQEFGKQTTRLNSFFPWTVTIYCFCFLQCFRCSFKFSTVLFLFLFSRDPTLQYHQKLWREGAVWSPSPKPDQKNTAKKSGNNFMRESYIVECLGRRVQPKSWTEIGW